MRPLDVVVAQFEGATTIRALPLAAGVLAAAVRRAGDVRANVSISHARRSPEIVARELAAADVIGLSLYTWNERYALEVSRRSKAIAPEVFVVAGGPSAPRRPDDVHAFLEQHPYVDALVAGEGERVFVDILRALQRGEAVDDLPGVATRTGVNPRAPRMVRTDFLDAGSPYVDGTFDDLLRSVEPPVNAAIFETNRGCPFSCAFCDWGQATESRVHELPIERVEAELRWAAERRIPYLYIIDANFGIRPRDLDIARYLGRLHAEYSFPQFVYFHLTKNATERNLATVETLRAAGIGTHVALSMQDFDATVLRAIDRSNIRPERALALRARAHAQGLPTSNEIILGLPAQTLASFRASVAAALTPFPADSFALYPARILVNAPMAEPAYRARWGLVTRTVPSHPRDIADDPFVVEREEIVVGSDSMSVDEWRAAFAAGFLLATLANQRLLATTLHVIQFALGGDCMMFVDRLLGASTPRLTAIRTELLRYADAILGETAMSLAVPGFGDARRDVTEAVTARVVADVAAFADEVADVIGMSFPDHRDLLRDAILWDALAMPDRVGPETRTFQWDWPTYVSAMGSGDEPLLPANDAITVRRSTAAWAASPTGAAYLDTFLALGWSKTPRVELTVQRRTGAIV